MIRRFVLLIVIRAHKIVVVNSTIMFITRCDFF